MKIIIFGGGLAGCTMAYLLKKRGHEPIIIEKEEQCGGIIRTFYTKEGLKYERGPHVLESKSKEFINFIESLIEVKQRTIMAGTFVEGKFFHYPLHIREIFKLKERDRIIEELYNLNLSEVPKTNFEDFLIAQMARTIYKKFYYGYTKKFWQIEPKKMTAEWATTRHIRLRTGKDIRTWLRDWQGYPKKDYNELIKKLIKKIKIIKGRVRKFNHKKGVYMDGDYIEGDFYINTLSIDDILDRKFGELEYRGVNIEFKILNKKHYFPKSDFKDARFSYVYYPNSKVPYTRISEYKNITGQRCEKTIISIETPSRGKRMWPFYTKESEDHYERYIKKVSTWENFMTIGRFGLYKYATMDSTVRMCMRGIKYFEGWREYSLEKRVEIYGDIRAESGK